MKIETEIAKIARCEICGKETNSPIWLMGNPQTCKSCFKKEAAQNMSALKTMRRTAENLTQYIVKKERENA